MKRYSATEDMMPIQALLDMQTRRDADYGREMRREDVTGLM